MIGKSLCEFIDTLYVNPEMEFTYQDKRYLISGYVESDGVYTLRLDTIEFVSQELFLCKSSSRQECVEKFECAKIFEGKDIYEVEKEIIVEYG